MSVCILQHSSHLLEQARHHLRRRGVLQLTAGRGGHAAGRGEDWEHEGGGGGAIQLCYHDLILDK